MKLKIFVVLLLLSSGIFAQVAPDKYFIEFLNKEGTPYSVSAPQAFLSQRAIDRRNAQGIAVTEDDLPVNPAYIDAVRNIGVQILNPTKWMNGVTVYTTDASKIDQIMALPFVKNVLKSSSQGNYLPVRDKFFIEQPYSAPHNKMTSENYNYGVSFNQIHMLNGEVLHNNGFRGQGKVIAVLDAGFINADTISAFDSMRNEGRILGTKDFVNPGGNVYQVDAAHGTMVLSTMGGNIPGQIIGTAPKASYWLLRPEDAVTENFIEEYNWVSAAEFADSAGADVINSSLGYTTFNDTTWNHSCADMNGNTTPVTRGANMAAQRGIAVINSAGNSGGSGWTCVGAPSDGDDVVAVAAVDANGNYAFFSSVGVDTGGRVKPNVAAQGLATWVIGGSGGLVQSNGTSFSSPIIAGMVACLWQSHPEKSRAEVVDFMQRSCSHYSNPDSLTGYGIPDFSKALLLMGTSEMTPVSDGSIYPNPFKNSFTLTFNDKQTSGDVRFVLYDITGRRAGEWLKNISPGENRLDFTTPEALNSGVYILSFLGNQYRLIKR